jgi:thiamine pyrophosphokinase
VRALILVNGELEQPEVLRRRIRAAAFDLVLGADAGARHGITLDVTLDAVIGDFDSLLDSARQEIRNAEFITYPSEKDETDLELALLYAVQRDADQIVLVGVMGGRLEMSLANVLLLAHGSLRARRIEVWHGVQTGWLIKPPGEPVTGRPGDTLSLIPLGGAASGVTTEGLKYPLSDATLAVGTTRGISNQLENKDAHVALTAGLLLAVHTPDDGAERQANG